MSKRRIKPPRLNQRNMDILRAGHLAACESSLKEPMLIIDGPMPDKRVMNGQQTTNHHTSQHANQHHQSPQIDNTQPRWASGNYDPAKYLSDNRKDGIVATCHVYRDPEGGVVSVGPNNRNDIDWNDPRIQRHVKNAMQYQKEHTETECNIRYNTDMQRLYREKTAEINQAKARAAELEQLLKDEQRRRQEEQLQRQRAEFAKAQAEKVSQPKPENKAPKENIMTFSSFFKAASKTAKATAKTSVVLILNIAIAVKKAAMNQGKRLVAILNNKERHGAVRVIHAVAFYVFASVTLFPYAIYLYGKETIELAKAFAHEIKGVMKEAFKAKSAANDATVSASTGSESSGATAAAA